MSFKLLDKVTAIGASQPIKMFADIGVKNHIVEMEAKSLGTANLTAVEVRLQGSHTDMDAKNGLVTNPGIAKGLTTTNVANAAFTYLIAGTNYSVAVNAAGTAFSAAHRVTASTYGVILIYINAAGTITTQVPAATQAYATAALAHAAGDAMLTAATVNPNILNIGRILIQAGNADWVANTNDLTNASGLTTATFRSITSTFQDLYTYDFTATDLLNGRAIFSVKDVGVRYIRHFLATLTGTGSVSTRDTPVDDP